MPTVQILTSKTLVSLIRISPNFQKNVQMWLPINLLKSKLWYSNPFLNAKWQMNDDRQIAAQFAIFALLNYEVTGPIFTKILRDVEALVPLLTRAYKKRSCKNKDGQFWRLQNAPKLTVTIAASLRLSQTYSAYICLPALNCGRYQYRTCWDIWYDFCRLVQKGVVFALVIYGVTGPIFI